MYARFAVAFVIIGSILACGGSGSRAVKPKAQVPRQSAKSVKAKRGVHEVKVDAKGRYHPAELTIAKGDTVRWTFEDWRDTVVPVPNGLKTERACERVLAFDAGLPTGPDIGVPGGLFILNQDGPGLVEQAAGTRCAGKTVRVGKRQICPTGEPGGTLQSSWDSPAITGALIRLRWNEVHRGPNEFDWSILDREMNRAVASGKQFSVGVKAGKRGTPDWIFEQGGVERLSFQDWGSSKTYACKKPPCCGYTMDLGSPSDKAYKKQYFGMLKAMAEHIKEDASWYQALAMIKPGGLNFISAENRLPKRCEAGCLCNTEVWAKAKNPYSPEALKSFYDEQFSVIEQAFPGKAMSFMLIQDGFPLVADSEHYLRSDGKRDGLPPGAKQTEMILDLGREKYPNIFVAQHNAMGPGPTGNGKNGCFKRGERRSADGCPNRWALEQASLGVPIGFQSVNMERVFDNPTLDNTLRNFDENTEGRFLEIYEERAWQALAAGGVLDKSGSGHTLEQWNARLRGRADAPETYSFTFDGSQKQVSVLSRVRCGSNPSIGTIRVQ